MDIFRSSNLVLPFDAVQTVIIRRAPVYMKWQPAFIKLVTPVWSFLKILCLLAELNERKQYIG